MVNEKKGEKDEKKNIKRINEYIDSALVSEDEDGLDIVEDEDELSIAEDKNEITLGCYVKADGENIYSIPITATYAGTDSDDEDEYNNNIEDMKQEVTLDPQEVYEELIAKDTEVDFFDNISQSDLATLQKGTSVGNSFVDKDKFTYVYAKNTKAQVGGKKPKGYEKIASIDVHAYLIASGTKKKGTCTWDTLYTNAKVSGLGGRWIKSFVVQNRLYTTKNNSIYDYSIPIDEDTSTTAELGGEIGLSKEGLSGSISGGISYTFNPNKCDITTMGGEKYVKNGRLFLISLSQIRHTDLVHLC